MGDRVLSRRAVLGGAAVAALTPLTGKVDRATRHGKVGRATRHGKVDRATRRRRRGVLSLAVTRLDGTPVNAGDTVPPGCVLSGSLLVTRRTCVTGPWSLSLHRGTPSGGSAFREPIGQWQQSSRSQPAGCSNLATFVLRIEPDRPPGPYYIGGNTKYAHKAFLPINVGGQGVAPVDEDVQDLSSDLPGNTGVGAGSPLVRGHYYGTTVPIPSGSTQSISSAPINRIQFSAGFVPPAAGTYMICLHTIRTQGSDRRIVSAFMYPEVVSPQQMVGSADNFATGWAEWFRSAASPDQTGLDQMVVEIGQGGDDDNIGTYQLDVQVVP